MPSRTVAETLSAETRRRNLIEWFSQDGPVWKDEEHPELAAMGTEAYVRQLRQEWSARQSLLDSYEEGEETAAA